VGGVEERESLLGTTRNAPTSPEPGRLSDGEGVRDWDDEGGGGWMQGGETEGGNDNLPFLSSGESPPPLYSP
jgi:hypothetical protein